MYVSLLDKAVGSIHIHLYIVQSQLHLPMSHDDPNPIIIMKHRIEVPYYQPGLVNYSLQVHQVFPKALPLFPGKQMLPERIVVNIEKSLHM